MTTLIIGKKSNLSQQLKDKLKNVVLLSSRQLQANINILDEYKAQNINIIFNNFQTSTKLNDTNNLSQYIEQAIGLNSKILDYIQKFTINKIVYTSSSSVYGDNILCSETDELKPLNMHASLKLANEKMIEVFCKKNNIDYTITRIFNMYGGKDHFSIVSKIIYAIKNNQKITIVNHGNSVRDFIYIDDVVNVYLNLLELKNMNILNIGSGRGVSIKSILDFIKNKNINIDNIYKEELKTSTANIKVLKTIVEVEDFIQVQQYLEKKIDV